MGKRATGDGRKGVPSHHENSDEDSTSRHIDTTLFTEEEWSRIAESLQISGRGLEITSLLFTNATESQISEQLGISRHTVHAHIERVYRKLDVGSRVELVVRVIAEYLGR